MPFLSAHRALRRLDLAFVKPIRMWVGLSLILAPAKLPLEAPLKKRDSLPWLLLSFSSS